MNSLVRWRQLQNDNLRKINDFAGGLNNGSPAFSLADNESTEEYGFDMDYYPALKVHDGFSLFGAAGDAQINLLTNFGYENLCRVIGTKFQYYDITGQQWIDTVDVFDDSDWDSTNFNGKLIMVNHVDGVLKSWSGGAISDLSATAPSCRYITNDTVRVWVAIYDLIHYSAFLNETDWTSADNSGTVEYYTDDGDAITGITFFNGKIVVFKSKCFAQIFGTELDSISNSIGCVNYKTIAEASDRLFWLGDKEVYMYKYGEPVPIGDKIRGYLDDLNEDNLEKCWGGTDGKDYWLGLATGTNTEPNVTLIYSPKYNIWRVFDTTKQFRYACNYNLSGFKSFYIGDASGNVYAMNDGITNAGTVIEWSSTSKPFDEDIPEAEKEYLTMHIQATVPIGSTMTVGVSTEPDGSTFTTVHTVTASEDLQNTNIIIPLDTVPYAHWFRYRLSGTGPATIHSAVRNFRIEPVQD